MKVACLGLPEAPQGKHKVPDERLDNLAQVFRPPKVTYLSIEFLDEAGLNEAEAIICAASKKLDLVVGDLERIEELLSKRPAEEELLQRCQKILEQEKSLSDEPWKEEKKRLSNFNLLTLRPIHFLQEGELPDITSLIQLGYKLLGLNCFYTVNERELRAWPIPAGTKAEEAAGRVHSDMQRGFIRAEVVGYEDLINSGSLGEAKNRGLMHLEPRDYIVSDGDIIRFRFSV